MHAVEMVVAVDELKDGAMLVIGPERSVPLLNVVVRKRLDAEMLVIQPIGCR